jgi:hypothetical protein
VQTVVVQPIHPNLNFLEQGRQVELVIFDELELEEEDVLFVPFVLLLELR